MSAPCPRCSLLSVCAFAALVFASPLAPRALAQGCVAARGSGLPMSLAEFDESARWRASVSHRYLRSDRHYRGTHEEPNRQAEGSEVINDSHFLDLALTYALSAQTSFTLTLPTVVHDRSQVVRNSQRVILQRFHTQATGLGDVRIEAERWLWAPGEERRGNILVSLGLDLPTGEKDHRDTFQVYDTASGQILGVERTVDQSIQPGDGGWGIPLSVFAFRSLGAQWSVFFNGAYTFTPEEKSGVPTFRGNPFEAEMSIADTYMARAGFEYTVAPHHGVALSLALRAEGVPIEDLMGGSEGFRRPGYALSVEPGIAITRARWAARLYVPVAIKRERPQSVPDRQQSAATGTNSIGDAAFADHLIMSSVSVNF